MNGRRGGLRCVAKSSTGNKAVAWSCFFCGCVWLLCRIRHSSVWTGGMGTDRDGETGSVYTGRKELGAWAGDDGNGGGVGEGNQVRRNDDSRGKEDLRASSERDGERSAENSEVEDDPNRSNAKPLVSTTWEDVRNMMEEPQLSRSTSETEIDVCGHCEEQNRVPATQTESHPSSDLHETVQEFQTFDDETGIQDFSRRR